MSDQMVIRWLVRSVKTVLPFGSIIRDRLLTVNLQGCNSTKWRFHKVERFYKDEIRQDRAYTRMLE